MGQFSDTPNEDGTGGHVPEHTGVCPRPESSFLSPHFSEPEAPGVPTTPPELSGPALI